MSEVTFGVAVALWGVLPGLLLVRVLRADGSAVEHWAGAPGLSLALVAFAAYATELLGLPVRPLTVAALVLMFCLAALTGRSRPERAAPQPARLDSRGGPFEPPWPTFVPWLVMLLPFVVARQLDPVTDFLLLPPTMHDGLDHANWFRLVLESGSVDPRVLLGPPLGADGSPNYYPNGMHAVLALLAQTTTLDPMVVMTRGLVLISAALPLSVFAFVSQLTGRGWPAMAAAAAALMFWWLPYQVWGWGGYPLLTGAVAALPVSRLALSGARGGNPAAMIAAFGCGIGLLTIHPSQAFAALVICVTVSLTWVAARTERWWAALPFVAGLTVAGAGLVFGASWLDPVAAFVDKARVVGASVAGDPRYAWPVGVYAYPNGLFVAWTRLPLTVLYAAGAAFALRHRALWPFLALHVVGSLLVGLAPHQTWWTSLWYHAPERIWYLQYASLPALAGLGLAGVIAWLDRRARQLVAGNWTVVLWPVAFWAAFVTIWQPFTAAASRQLWLYGHRNENLTFTDTRVLADFGWIREHVPADAILFNAPADWGLPLPFTGRRTVFWSGGYAVDPSVNWNQLLSMLRAGEPHTSQAASELDRLGIRYVYAATLDRALEAGGRLPLHGATLDDAAGLEKLYESATASIWRVREEPGGWFGLQNSERIRYYGFTGVEGEAGREWRWTAGQGRVRIWPGPVGEGRCFLRVLGPALDTFEARIDGAMLAPSGQGLEVPRAYADREFFDLFIRRAETPAVSLPPDQPPPEGVRVTDIALRCGG